MIRKFRNFQEFFQACDELYAMYEPHFLLQDCEIVTNFEGNEIDNGCWYCIIQTCPHTYTILAYDHTADCQDNRFVVYCDWNRVPTNPCGPGAIGYFTECKDFDNLEEAVYFMVQTPSSYYRKTEDLVFLQEKGNDDVCYNGYGEGLIESIKYLNSTKDNYSGKTLQVKQKNNWGENILFQKTFAKQ